MSRKSKSQHIHSGADNSAPYPVSRLAPGFSLVDLAKEIEQADIMLNNTAHAKLRVIADQIAQLKQAAHTVLEQTQLNQQLHRATCQFKKIPGKTYHLYEKQSGERFFSMLNPEEWGKTGLHTFLGSYQLQNDLSWLSVSEQPANDDYSINSLLDSL